MFHQPVFEPGHVQHSMTEELSNLWAELVFPWWLSGTGIAQSQEAPSSSPGRLPPSSARFHCPPTADRAVPLMVCICHHSFFLTALISPSKNSGFSSLCIHRELKAGPPGLHNSVTYSEAMDQQQKRKEANLFPQNIAGRCAGAWRLGHFCSVLKTGNK